jgi:hypothetical protein
VVVNKDEEVENIKIIDFGFSNYLSKLQEKKGDEGTCPLKQTSWLAPPTTSLRKCSGKKSSASRSTTSPSGSSSTSCTLYLTEADWDPALQRLHHHLDPGQHARRVLRIRRQRGPFRRVQGPRGQITEERPSGADKFGTGSGARLVQDFIVSAEEQTKDDQWEAEY